MAQGKLAGKPTSGITARTAGYSGRKTALLPSTRRPSGLKVARVTPSSCRRAEPTGAAVATRHTWAVLSELAVTTYAPFGLNEAWVTDELWRRGLKSCFPVTASQI